MSEVVCLHGGGSDSMVLAWQQHKMGARVLLVWFDFGQVTASEQRNGAEATRKLILADGGYCTLHVLDVRDLFTSILGPYRERIPQLTGTPAVPRTVEAFDDALDDGVSYAEMDGFGWIPGRNGFFLLNAAMFAASRGIYRVMWAMNSELKSIVGSRWQAPEIADDMWFPFLERLNLWLVTCIGMPVEVVTPHMHQSKLEVTRLGLALGLTMADIHRTYSCEHTPVCWVCEQCEHMITICNTLQQWPENFPASRRISCL